MRLTAWNRFVLWNIMVVIFSMIVILIIFSIYIPMRPIVIAIKMMMGTEVIAALVLLVDLFNRKRFVLGRYEPVVSEDIYGGVTGNVKPEEHSKIRDVRGVRG